MTHIDPIAAQASAVMVGIAIAVLLAIVLVDTSEKKRRGWW